jgi:hypothetical protein
MAHWSLGNTSNSSTMGKHPQAALMIVDPHIRMEHQQNTPIATLMNILLMVNFGAPNILVALWFELDYGTNPPLGTLMI